MAAPNALFTFMLATFLQQPGDNDFTIGGSINVDDETSEAALMVIGGFTTVMIFILWNRSNTAYNRWWEGGTLLQKTRGEWFNAYSSIMAFTSTKPELQEEVEAYTHLLARLMSLLMCCGLQQVSPNRDRPFEIIDLDGIEPESMDFLNQAPDKVEIILQWIQRSMVLHSHTGVLPVAPPILSRAFQEVSRGIVNLQNARKIADFPYPFPLAQVSMILQLLHWATVPLASSLALPRGWATLFSFFSIFVLWCIHFNAVDLEFPFGSRANDLPMMEMQQDWNNSVSTLLDKRATRPPNFKYNADRHQEMAIVMSDASDLYIPSKPVLNKGVARIRIKQLHKRKRANRASMINQSSVPSYIDETTAGHQAASKASRDSPSQEEGKEGSTEATDETGPDAVRVHSNGTDSSEKSMTGRTSNRPGIPLSAMRSSRFSQAGDQAASSSSSSSPEGVQKDGSTHRDGSMNGDGHIHRDDSIQSETLQCIGIDGHTHDEPLCRTNL